MRKLLHALVVALLATTVAGCGASIQVRTLAAPDAGLDRLQTFRLLPEATRRDGRTVSGADDPMVSNSIANRAMRDRVGRSFTRRGYAEANEAPDFVVAFYATAEEVLDVGAWDYGYPANEWPRHGRQVPPVAQYTRGTVVIDVIGVRTRQLLWRGAGSTELVDDPANNLGRLIAVAEAVVSHFPAATPPVVAQK
jgi:hypothetical protein